MLIFENGWNQEIWLFAAIFYVRKEIHLVCLNLTGKRMSRVKIQHIYGSTLVNSGKGTFAKEIDAFIALASDKFIHTIWK